MSNDEGWHQEGCRCWECRLSGPQFLRYREYETKRDEYKEELAQIEKKINDIYINIGPWGADSESVKQEKLKKLEDLGKEKARIEERIKMYQDSMDELIKNSYY